MLSIEHSEMLLKKKLDNYVQMKYLTYTYFNRRARSVQECVVHIFPDQWPRNTFPAIFFGNSNIL